MSSSLWLVIGDDQWSMIGDEQRSMLVEDADAVIERRPDWVKGYVRKGAAEHALGRHDAALETYANGLRLEPGHKGLVAGVASAKEARSREPVKLQSPRWARQHEGNERRSIRPGAPAGRAAWARACAEGV